jgi:hypothetical protein
MPETELEALRGFSAISCKGPYHGFGKRDEVAVVTVVVAVKVEVVVVAVLLVEASFLPRSLCCCCFCCCLLLTRSPPPPPPPLPLLPSTLSPSPPPLLLLPLLRGLMGGWPALLPASCSELWGEDDDEEGESAAVAAVAAEGEEEEEEEEEDEAVREGTSRGTASDCKKVSTCPPKPVTGNWAQTLLLKDQPLTATTA